MKRLTFHWTGGTLNPNDTDLAHYHFLVDGLGKVHNGRLPVSANNPPNYPGEYIAHCFRANTNNIGVAACGMFGATEAGAKKGDYGKYPLTQDCINGCIKLIANLCRQYGIPVTKERILGHLEWTTIMGKRQERWDVGCIPSLDIRPKKLKDGSYAAMNYIREEVRKLVHPVSFVEPLRGWRKVRALWAFRGLYGLEGKLSQETREKLHRLRERPEFDKLK